MGKIKKGLPTTKLGACELEARLLAQGSDYETYMRDILVYGTTFWEDDGKKLSHMPPTEVVVKTDGTFERVKDGLTKTP
jgi:hypothetical protein